MKIQNIYLMVLILSMFSGIWPYLIAKFTNKWRIMIGFVVACGLSFLLYLPSLVKGVDTPLIITIAIPYEYIAQLICYKYFFSLYQRPPQYRYSDTQLMSPGLTPDNAYMLIILIFGAIPLVMYANYLHNKL